MNKIIFSNEYLRTPIDNNYERLITERTSFK